MIVSLFGLGFTFLVAGFAFGDEEDRPADRAEIEALMQRLQRGIAERDSVLLMTTFDSTTTLKAVEEQGLLQGIDAGARLGFKLGFGLGMRVAIGQGDFVDAFESFDVRHVAWVGDDRTEVYVRHKDADGLVQ